MRDLYGWVSTRLRPSRPGYLLAALAAVVVGLILLPPVFGWSAIQDDYFYYERIARHLVAGQGSTFDGMVQTNGYQPLWMLFVAVAVIIERFSGIAAQHTVLVMSAALAAVTLVAAAEGDDTQVDPFELTVLLALAAALAFFAAMGMESTVLLLCGALLYRHLRRHDYRVDAACGVLLGLCFLARIDSVVYFAPLLGYPWLQTPRPGKVAFTVPLVGIVAAYLVANKILFGTPVPISGIAKSVLADPFRLHPATWVTLFRGLQFNLIMAIAALLTLWAYAGGASRERWLAAASVLGIALFYCATSMRSDWILWEWYKYPFALHLLLLAQFRNIQLEAPALRGIAVVTLCGACVAIASTTLRTVREAERSRSIADAAVKLQALLANEPGAVVAMGDRAGFVGAVLPNRLVQLEGLVMDPAYLESLRKARSLQQLLQAYRVDYYVASNPTANGSGCFLIAEPMQSQGASIQLKDRICLPVVSDFVLQGNRTVVFKVARTGDNG